MQASWGERKLSEDNIQMTVIAAEPRSIKDALLWKVSWALVLMLWDSGEVNLGPGR